MTTNISQLKTRVLQTHILKDSDGFEGENNQTLISKADGTMEWRDISNVSGSTDYLNLTQPANDTILAPDPQESIYKYTYELGDNYYQKNYQNDIIQHNNTPTELKQIPFINGIPYHGVVLVGRGSAVNVPVGSGSNPISYGEVVGGRDRVVYDPCNLRHETNIANEYYNFMISDSLPVANVSGQSIWGSGVPNAILKLDYQYECDFGSAGNNGVGFILRVNEAGTYNTQTSGPSRGFVFIETKFTTGQKLRTNGTYNLDLASSFIKVGDVIEVGIGPEDGTDNAMDTLDMSVTWSWIPI